MPKCRPMEAGRKGRANSRRVLSRILLGAALSLFVGCSGDISGEASRARTVLRLATTTSTRDSGLLDPLLPPFEKAQSCRVDVVAVGTGAALRLGERGDADVLIVHAREAEMAFMDAGHGTRHEEFMYNDFVLLGPEEDPARIRNAPPTEALKTIAAVGGLFFSRGDDSGTHRRELTLWEAAGGRPEWGQYIESGQGMGPTLIMADEKRGYVLADSGTYLKLREKIELVPLAAPAASMRNPYAVIAVAPDKHERINAKLAGKLVDYLISDEAQGLIAAYRVGDQQLFFPTRLDRSSEGG